MDEISKTNRIRWNALATANVEYSRPFLDFTKEDAAKYVNRHGILGPMEGKKVLCLASGGGQDSAAFGLLGAHVTVFDLSDVQLERDRAAAKHHGYSVNCIQGDMRDLSALPENHFDLVWQIYSINFVPSVEPVIQGARRILKQGGTYFLMFANPFTMAIDGEKWDGSAYPLNSFYVDHEDLSQRFPTWDVDQPDGARVVCESPHEFRHTLSSVLNTLITHNFKLLGLWEWMKPEENPEPGSWPHFTRMAPPYFSTFWKLEK